MAVKHKAQRAAVGVILDQALKYVDKDPQANLLKIADKAQSLLGSVFPKKSFEKAREVIADPENVWNQYAMNVLRDVDRGILKQMGLAFGLHAGYYGTKTVRENREKYNCNIPWIILMDPTSACNLKCKGCWAAEYGHRQNLTLEEMNGIVSQGKDMGTHFYMFTGGEPLVRKSDVLQVCEDNPDCAFLAYTNATLVDQAFCDELKRVGNLALAISIEGSEADNDSRRGDGCYDKVVEAMDLLRKNGCLFGMSVCYTRRNVESVTSDEFLDLMLEKGVKFGLYFNFMPVGHDADPALIPSPAQRKYMYSWLRKMRSAETGKPLFIMDFQNDGEYVGGCIAGGRRYFHVNSAGDIEPCVFIHYSDSNIRTHTLIEALQRPLFQAYRRNQPFNDNHLRPCPMLENPQALRKMVKETGAKSTDLLAQEDVDTLCARCDQFAAAWAPEAEILWTSTPHGKFNDQYYRDTPEGRAELAARKRAEEVDT